MQCDMPTLPVYHHNDSVALQTLCNSYYGMQCDMPTHQVYHQNDSVALQTLLFIVTLA